MTVLHSFSGADGREPYAGLKSAADGSFYGTTRYGGANDTGWCVYRCGTVFRITSSGILTTLHSFSGSDGSGPGSAHLGDGPGVALVQGSDGSLYGTTEAGRSS
jgi:hypothetical protein